MRDIIKLAALLCISIPCGILAVVFQIASNVLESTADGFMAVGKSIDRWSDL